MDVPFIGGAYRGRSPAVDGQETVNFYLEYLGVTTGGYPQEYFYGAKQKPKATSVLFPTPGLVPFNTDITSGPCRCLYTTSTGRMFAVNGNTLYEYSKYSKKTVRGVLKTTSGTVNMADCGAGAGRGYGICIVDGQYGYNFNLSNNTFEQILDTSFPKSQNVIFMNGFFVVCEVNSGRFWFSQLYNCLDWSDLDNSFVISSAIPSQTGPCP